MFINLIIQIIQRFALYKYKLCGDNSCIFAVRIAEKRDTAASLSFTLLCSRMVQDCSEKG